MSRPKINPDTVKKVCTVCNKEFEISFYLRNKRTYCSKTCANHDPKVIEKMKLSQESTFTEKYGMHPMKTEKTKENLRNSIKEKYGVDWISSHPDWYSKVKENNLKKYGTEIFNNFEKSRETCLKNYGVAFPQQSEEIKQAIIKTKLDNHFKHLEEYCIENKISMLFNRDDYLGHGFENKYRFKCNICSFIFDSSIYNAFNSLYCEKCDPNRQPTLENSFFDFLNSLTPQMIVKRHDRTILMGKELDFFIPEKKIAFELNGLYWHSEIGGGITRNYHLNKTKSTLSHGIRLVHIFENEWLNKPELIKSVIKTILKFQSSKPIYARECQVKEVGNEEKGKFLDLNHLQQNDKSTIKLGLYHDNKLISLMTFRKTSRFDKRVEWELSRFCNLRDTIVPGGASKLFSHFIKTYSPKSIVSYSDRRFFSGDLYHMLKFSFVSVTPPSYYYLSKDYKCMYNRMQFQKHLLSKKLPNFNPELSEWENMRLNGFDRIWDCGNTKWVWKP